MYGLLEDGIAPLHNFINRTSAKGARSSAAVHPFLHFSTN
jgi:hypothetical protein